MVMVGKVVWKRGRTRNTQLKDKGSDDSDKDYMAEEDEVSDDGDDLEDYCSSFDGDELEENLDDFEEEEGDKKVKKVVRSKAKMGSSNKRKMGGKISRKRKRVSYNEEKDDEEEDHDFDDEEFMPEGDDSVDEEDMPVKRGRISCIENVEEKDDEEGEYDFDDEDDEEFMPEEVDSLDEEDMPVKRGRISCNEDVEEKDDEEEGDYDFDDEDDEEFTPEGVDSLDEEEDMPVKKKMMAKKKVGRQVLRKKGSVKTKKRKRNSKVLKKPTGRRGRSKTSLRRKVKNCDDDGPFTRRNPVMSEKIKKRHVRRNKRLIVQSDSDLMSPGSSDNDFTISEEERKQVREAGMLCKTLSVSLRSSSTSKRTDENVDLHQQRKPLIRKGKEKVEDVKNEAVKQVCGICLSEEGKRTVRGTLNCCSHYFCFACIMEWSKVESRCPLCKQRFVTISKPGRSNTCIDLRDVAIQVPERNQIYQPSEEEIRGYLDPYEHVICTECHRGGDDNLMLLCDLCDSPAHTYCVGLGQEVPEGNWYCEGCRPVALASLNSQTQNPLPDQRTISINLSSRSSPSENMGQGLVPTTMPSPFSQGIGSLASPRYSFGDVLLASPRSGAGVSTLSGRRYIHRQIRSFLTSNRMAQMVGRTDETSAANLRSDYPGFQVDQGIETTYQHTRTPEAGTSYYNFFGERLHDNSSQIQNGVPFPATSSNFIRQVVQAPIPTTSEGDAQVELQTGSNLISGHEQLHQCSSRSSIESVRNVSSFAMGEAIQLYIEKEQVQLMVESYLKSISQNLGLDDDTFEDVARKSTHTILAACGLEHRTSEVYTLQQQPPPNCSHVERMTDQQMSLMKGYCSSCFQSFARHVVKTIMNGRLPPFLWVRD